MQTVISGYAIHTKLYQALTLFHFLSYTCAPCLAKTNSVIVQPKALATVSYQPHTYILAGQLVSVRTDEICEQFGTAMRSHPLTTSTFTV